MTKNGVKTKVRLIGVNTPESVHSDESKNNEYGITASNKTKKQFPIDTEVLLEYDAEATDRYGRDLVYLYFFDEATQITMYNEVLLKEGYANCMAIEPNTRYKSEFKKIADQAKSSNAGFWKHALELDWK